MNDLLEPFLAEARELIQAATEDLLALEAARGDAEAVTRIFRAFHTLKGSVGLFDFPPMLAALHAAEDGLAAARASTIPVDSRLSDLALETLDAAARWTDAIEAEGSLPEAAKGEAETLTSRYRVLLTAGQPAAAEAAAPPALSEWAARLAVEAPPGAGAVLAFRYVPSADCFFTGDDPLGLVRRLPGLLALTVGPAEPWPPAAMLDVFACNLVIEGLTAAPRAEVEAVFRLVGDQVTIVALPERAASEPAGGRALDPVCAAILEEQVRALTIPVEAEIEPGHRETAARAAGNALRAAGRETDAGRCAQAAGQGREALAGLVATLLAGAGEPAATTNAPVETAAEPGLSGEAVRTLRVDAGRVDTLVALVGELVVARNALRHLAARTEAAESGLGRSLVASDALIGRLAGELHRGIVALRLLPLGQVFRRFARPLREIARGLGKEVVLVLEGEETEADKGIVENLFEPLLHVVRNAADHGLEDAEGRRLAGKPAAGRIVLRAESAGDSLVVTVSDDGRGIDPAVIRRRAAENGLRTPEALAALDDTSVTDLVFAPGFSTARSVSDISGRGIGMDAVRAAATRLGGTVSIESRLGLGTSVRLALPRTVSLTRIMLAGIGADLYGVPVEAVAEVARVARARIHDLGTGTATVLRGRTVPVVRLADLFGATGVAADPEQARLIVLRTGDEWLALEVDRFEDRIDALVRPPAGLIAHVPWVGGTTLMGDGRVLLVLDPAALLDSPHGSGMEGSA